MQSTLLWLFQRHKAYYSPPFTQEVHPNANLRMEKLMISSFSSSSKEAVCIFSK